MNVRAAITISAALALLSCPRPRGLMHVITPVERPDVAITRDGAALVRSVLCDITAEHVDEDLWRRMTRSGAFSGADGTPLPADPPVIMFHLILKNTTNAPVWLADARISDGREELRALSPAGLVRRLAPLAARGPEYGRLLSYRLLLEERESARSVNHTRDSVECRYDFIAPRDTALRLVAFDRLPVRMRSFRLLLTFAAPAREKTVAIDFVRQEYRASGHEFRRPEAPLRKADRDE